MALFAASTGSAITSLVVSVMGTTLVGDDAADRFNLVGVPPGDIELRFTGGGVDSNVRLSQVLAAQTVSLVVNITGAAVVVDSEIRTTSMEQLEGRVESLPPTMAAGSLIVAGRTARRIRRPGSSRAARRRPSRILLIGMRVHVEGTGRARYARISDPNPEHQHVDTGRSQRRDRSALGQRHALPVQDRQPLVKENRTDGILRQRVRESFAMLKDGVPGRGQGPAA